MIDRRCFLQTGAVAASGLLWPLAPQALARGATIPAPRLVLHDSRFPASLALAAAMVQVRGAPAPPSCQVSGNITRLWCDTLQPLWRTGPVPVAGVTGTDVLFCLEHLAADHGLRLAAREVLQHGGDQALVAWHLAPRQSQQGTRS